MNKLPMLKLPNLIQEKNLHPSGMIKAAGFHLHFTRVEQTTEVYMPLNGKEYTTFVEHPDPDAALQNAVFRTLCDTIDSLRTPLTDSDVYRYIKDAELLDPAEAHLLVPMLDSPRPLWRAVAIMIIDKDE